MSATPKASGLKAFERQVTVKAQDLNEIIANFEPDKPSSPPSPAVTSTGLPAAQAEVRTHRGTIEVLRKGEQTWLRVSPTGPSVAVAEGDQIRSAAGGSVDLRLADGSDVLVAENTRFVVTRMQYSAVTRERNFGFHIVTGKIRAGGLLPIILLVRLCHPSPSRQLQNCRLRNAARARRRPGAQFDAAGFNGGVFRARCLTRVPLVTRRIATADARPTRVPRRRRRPAASARDSSSASGWPAPAAAASSPSAARCGRPA